MIEKKPAIALPEEMSLEERRFFFRDYDKWCDLFGQDAVDRHLMNYPIAKLVDIDRISQRNGYTPKVSKLLGQQVWSVRYHSMHKGHQWERTEQEMCNAYLVPHHYQGLYHGEMIRAILTERFPWLEGYKTDIYELHFYDRASDCFYVRLSTSHQGHASLYVPYKAFLALDADAIIQRTVGYLRSYMAQRTEEERGAMERGIMTDPVTNAFIEDIRKAKEAQA